MPLVLGAGAVAFAFLVILTLFSVYWLLTQGSNFLKSLIYPLNLLAQAADWLRDRNMEIIHSMANVMHGLIIWAIEAMNAGFRLLHDAYSAITLQPVTLALISLQATQALVNSTISPILNETYRQLTDIQREVHGFVELNISAFNFWKDGMTTFTNNFVIPSINSLIARMDYVTGLTIPTIQARLGVAENNLNVTLPAEIAETKTDVSAVQRELARTTTAPGTGLMDRVGGIEGTLGQVLPWLGVIGLSIPIARALARVGRNPCTCLEEDGQTDMLPLLFYLFEEAG